jgi:S-adenosylmethionine uptake transporter
MGAVKERTTLALLFSLAASVFFAGMGVCVRALGPSVGIPETVFFRGFVGGVAGLLVHLVLRIPLRTSAPGVLLIRTITGTLSLFCYYGAIEGIGSQAGTLATANLLLKTAPVWVALGAGFLLGEKTGARTWVALAVGVAGATLALLGPTGPAGGRESVGLGLLSGLFAAGAYLAVRKLAVSEDPFSVVTLFSLGVAAIMAPIVAWRWRPLPSGQTLELLIGVSACGTVAQVLMTHAYRHGRAAIVAVSGLAEIAFAVAASVVVFHESIHPATFAGGALAVVAGLVATWPTRQVEGPALPGSD